MRVRALAATALALFLGACTDSADPMNVFSPSADEASASLARQRYGSVQATAGAERIRVGDTVRVTAKTRAKYGLSISPRRIHFSSSDSTVARVDRDGLVTGRRVGSVIIRVAAEGNGVKWKAAERRLTVISSNDPLDEGTDGVTGDDQETETSDPGESIVTPAPAPPAPEPSQPVPSAPVSPPPPVVSNPTQPVVIPQLPGFTRLPGAYPHEPASFVPIADRPFQTKVPFTPIGSYPTATEKLMAEGFSSTEARYTGFTIAPDPSAPMGDGSVGQMFYPATHQAGTGPATTTKYLPPGVKSMYLSIWAKISSNWVGNQSSGNKMFFIGTAGGNNQFFFSANGAGSAPLHPHLMWQGVVDVDANNQRRRVPNVSPNQGQQIVRGVWQHWEFLFTCNSAVDVFDGTADLWIDGKHITTAKDISWFQGKHPDRPCQMNVFNWNPTYGGGGASPGADQYLWFDHVYISGK